MTPIMCHDEILHTTETVLVFTEHSAAEAALAEFLQVEEDEGVIYYLGDDFEPSAPKKRGK